ncbi:prostatic acid phosphatase [Anolis carolinensis]|uniref:prostatic acid phosphatase n=1 Tax=Anolis carolinensis TaxID=28377 RepID=UPI002F2B7413
MGISVVCLMYSFTFLSIFFGLLLQSTSGRELKFLVTVFRHGDRTPISTFPTNPVKEDVWPQGYEQLTKIGIQQHYSLGQYIRKTYSKLLSEEYKRKEIYVYSTDYDRTIMSAQANLAGLFPPVGKQIWNNKLLWQPIPVHTMPQSQEKLLSYPSRTCKRFLVLLKETMAAKEVLGKVKPKMKFIGKMAAKMGFDTKSVLDFTNHKLWNAYDALIVQQIHSHPLPAWATPQAMGQMKQLMGLALSALFGVHKREEKSRLQGGVLVKAILDDMTKATYPNNELKMKMYSGHDMTIAALQVALNVFEAHLPSYAASQFFELYKEDNGGYTIEMYYRADVNAERRLLTLPGCEKACPLEKFKKLVSPILADNVEEECNKV